MSQLGHNVHSCILLIIFISTFTTINDTEIVTVEICSNSNRNKVLHYFLNSLLIYRRVLGVELLPGADIGSDHELVMMTFKLYQKRVKKLGHARIKFDLEKLKDPEVAEAFHAMIGGKFEALTILVADGYRHGHVDQHLQHSSDQHRQ